MQVTKQFLHTEIMIGTTLAQSGVGTQGAGFVD